MTTPTSPENEQFLDQVADVLYRYGLHTSARIALEAGRPIAFIGGQLLWIAQPALSLLLPAQKVRQTAHLLEEPAAVDALIARLEQKES